MNGLQHCVFIRSYEFLQNNTFFIDNISKGVVALLSETKLVSQMGHETHGYDHNLTYKVFLRPGGIVGRTYP